MSSNSEHELQRLLRLPWTVLREETPEGDVVLRVKEIPSAVGSGDTDEERVADLWESLTASLRAYLHFGDTIPLPAGVPDGLVKAPPADQSAPMLSFIADDAAQTSGSVALAAFGRTR